ncbi:hypothetical protein FISHEDRAFT_75728 [Fistulina hepatica ATCC 64428]|uniref:Uncharacterized protein n=1 Tax=Fistulina hepatica ATCC 64428 TaxID=1128425 RepID=A0A0D7A5J0_9AGAR|nr:hypothetical protein FISHEDRAFT_75728 [Fistulina hepatica ATCC 64428]
MVVAPVFRRGESNVSFAAQLVVDLHSLRRITTQRTHKWLQPNPYMVRVDAIALASDVFASTATASPSLSLCLAGRRGGAVLACHGSVERRSPFVLEMRVAGTCAACGGDWQLSQLPVFAPFAGRPERTWHVQLRHPLAPALIVDNAHLSRFIVD